MIEPILQCLHVAEEHRAGAAAAKLMPGAMGLEILVGGFLALRDGVTHVLPENFRAPASERIQPGFL